jgi:hypothetical protein
MKASPRGQLVHDRKKCVAGQLTVEANPPAKVSAVIGWRAAWPKMRPSVANAGS